MTIAVKKSGSLKKPGERQWAILQQAVRDGQFVDESRQDRDKAAGLNGKGLLSRDKKQASLWFPTEAGRQLVRDLQGLEDLYPPLSAELTSPHEPVEWQGGRLDSTDAGQEYDGSRAVALQQAPHHEGLESGAGDGAIVAPSDASGLEATVARAMALLDTGDVMAAHMLAAGAYAQAKTAATFAQRFNAGEKLIAKARRLQGDALLIETRAKMLIVDEWDVAKDSGLVSKGGRPVDKPVSQGNGLSENGITAESTGLSRKELYEARILAEKEKISPGLVERAIHARIEQGLEPSKGSLKFAIGTKSATNEERGNNLYETPIEAMNTLLALERFSGTVWEPSCGRGAIVRPLEAAGYDVRLSDLIDYGTADRHGECQMVVDFLTTVSVRDGCDIVTNPPYGTVLNAYVAHALKEHRPRKMALLLNLNFQCGFADDDRNFVLDVSPPSRVWVFKRRLPMMHRDGWDGPKASSSMNTAWFVWELQPDGTYGDTWVTRRVDWADYLNLPLSGKPTSPLQGGRLNSADAASRAAFAAAQEDAEFARETPRVTLEDRVASEIERAREWAHVAFRFDAGDFRRGMGVRPSVADALLTALVADGAIRPDDEFYLFCEGGQT